MATLEFLLAALLDPVQAALVLVAVLAYRGPLPVLVAAAAAVIASETIMGLAAADYTWGEAIAPRLASEDIHEMRGMLLYRRFVWGIDDVAAANQLLARAEADLRRTLSPGRDPSGSYVTLSGVMFAQGKYAEAEAAFGQVQGGSPATPRIARLWAIQSKIKASPAAASAAP